MKIFVLFFFFSLPLFAGTENKVQELIDNCESSLTGHSHWSWSVVRVRAILEMGIKVPMISNFSINPEVELFFVKK